MKKRFALLVGLIVISLFIFSCAPQMVYEAKDEDPMHRFPSSPPGDPTLGKVGGQWFMYYGQHTKGIYYAILEN